MPYNSPLGDGRNNFHDSWIPFHSSHSSTAGFLSSFLTATRSFLASAGFTPTIISWSNEPCQFMGLGAAIMSSLSPAMRSSAIGLLPEVIYFAEIPRAIKG